MPAVGELLSINVSPERGSVKQPCGAALLQVDLGIAGDGHAGDWHRQLSLLNWEHAQTALPPGESAAYGEFAENLDISGLELHILPPGTRLRIGEALVEITQIGKDLREHPSPFELKGNGLMPREAAFARVLSGGRIGPGDAVRVEEE
ncbi:MAG: hypothetical protein P9M14_14330 [Candidatus Alcyoniella australis]|nr:hypothetical protein [Candidatus Alcyoniella australis]